MTGQDAAARAAAEREEHIPPEVPGISRGLPAETGTAIGQWCAERNSGMSLGDYPRVIARIGQAEQQPARRADVPRTPRQPGARPNPRRAEQ